MENRYFYCYSTFLKNYFLENGLRFICQGVHKKTHKSYWVFEGTDTLNELLDKWRKARP